ncbi:hypothetical protein SLEP1_g43902 [Rubroshorea leprosula]|uniref:Disease resistance N-terminal domain-containing protein n=1 Tax=Rubroshorea leprosula TaxID=152421 RepID=A0AAV5LEI5_9ROSI|nr:hypothetical protein SLEP1_g43902 [Rubroshorea leprosula]
MADLILAPIVDTAISKVISYGFNQSGLGAAYKLELRKFTFTLSMVRALLQDAEKQHVTSHPDLKPWLKGLLAIVDEAHDIVEEFTYKSLLRKVAARKPMWKQVNIERCAKLKSPPSVSELTNLQMLHILDCKELSSIGESLSTSVDLKKLMIRKCPSLIYVPNLHGLSSLHTLTIEECDGLTSLPSGLSSCSALEELRIHCNYLTSIPEDLNAFCSLVRLDISRCRNLISIPGESLGSLACLKALCIGGFSEELEVFPDLNSIYHLKSSLENLTVIGWEKLRHLPHQIQHLTHLRKLSIKDFHGVEALPEWLGELTSLRSLSIIDCKSLKHMLSMDCPFRLQFFHIDNCPCWEYY